MGASRNMESTRQENVGVIYYDRGILSGKDGRRYQRYAIKTHFVQPGEDQADSIGIRMDQLVVLFFCHLYHTPFNNID